MSTTRLTAAQARRAARIYLLANTACLDTGGCDTDEETRVVALAIEQARRSLERMGLEYCQVYSLEKCIAMAQGGAS